MRAVIVLCLVACCGVAAAADYSLHDLGTLFTTPAARQGMDRQRSEVARDSDTATSRAPGNVRVDGIVRRSDGSSTVWVNGESNLKSNAVGGVRVPQRQRAGDRVTVYVDGRQVRIRPGESWSQGTKND
jgi:hypothetical protein